MIKCVVFDLDGTLLDTISTITYYVNRTLQSFGFEPITEDECKYFAGDGPENLIRRSLHSKGCDDEALLLTVLSRYKANYAEAPLYLTEPFSGIVDMLKSLSSRGVKVAVVSNKQDEAVADVVSHFFGELVHLSRGSRAGVPLKPAPDALFDVMHELDVKASEVAYVGDTNVDMQTGRAFGAALTVGVLWGFRERRELVENGADVIVSSVRELLSEVTR